MFLSAHDPDPFNRYEAVQQLASQLLLRAIQSRDVSTIEGELRLLTDVLRCILTDPTLDGSFKALTLELPGRGLLADLLPHGTADVQVIREVVREVNVRLGSALAPLLLPLAKLDSSVDDRALAASALYFLCAADDTRAEGCRLARQAFVEGKNMSTRMAALAALNDVACQEREDSLREFFQIFEKEPLVIIKWLRLVASSDLEGTLSVSCHSTCCAAVKGIGLFQ